MSLKLVSTGVSVRDHISNLTYKQQTFKDAVVCINYNVRTIDKNWFNSQIVCCLSSTLREGSARPRVKAALHFFPLYILHTL